MFSVSLLGFEAWLGGQPSSLNHTNQKDDYRQHQQNVNESPKSVRTDHSQEPQHDKNYADCPKHLAPLFHDGDVSVVAFQTRRPRKRQERCWPTRDHTRNILGAGEESGCAISNITPFCFPRKSILVRPSTSLRNTKAANQLNALREPANCFSWRKLPPQSWRECPRCSCLHRYPQCLPE